MARNHRFEPAATANAIVSLSKVQRNPPARADSRVAIASYSAAIAGYRGAIANYCANESGYFAQGVSYCASIAGYFRLIASYCDRVAGYGFGIAYYCRSIVRYSVTVDGSREVIVGYRAREIAVFAARGVLRSGRKVYRLAVETPICSGFSRCA